MSDYHAEHFQLALNLDYGKHCWGKPNGVDFQKRDNIAERRDWYLMWQGGAEPGQLSDYTQEHWDHLVLHGWEPHRARK